jgi:hypothetical protein
LVDTPAAAAIFASVVRAYPSEANKFAAAAMTRLASLLPVADAVQYALRYGVPIVATGRSIGKPAGWSQPTWPAPQALSV